MVLGLIRSAAILAVAGLASASPALAGPTLKHMTAPMDGLSAQVKPEGPTPKRPDGHPDLSGMWTVAFPALYMPPGGYGARGGDTLEPDQATLDRSYMWNKPVYKPKYWQAVMDADFGDVTADPQFSGVWQGLPRMGPPQKIIQTDQEILLMNAGPFGDHARFVPLDGRPRDPLDSDQETFNGIGLGHWDGDTLVVESTGFNDRTWLAWQGYIHSNRMTVTERYRRVGDVLYWQYTVDDPEYFQKPWTSSWIVERLNKDPKARLEEAAPYEEHDMDKIQDPRYRG